MSKRYVLTALIVVFSIILVTTRGANAQTQQYTSQYTPASVQPAYADPNFRPEPLVSPQNPEHPLAPVLRWAQQGRFQVAQIQDYTAILRKQENIDGKLQDGSIMSIKIRHQPFSVYVKFLAPQSVSGQEVLYVRGQNNEKMLAHGVGIKKLAGTITLVPDGPVAMNGNKYPLTDIGILNLLDKLLEVGTEDSKYGECNVQYYENVKLGERLCTCIEVVHPKQYKEFRFHLVRIYVDNELKVPIRYESYDWPKQPGEKLALLEAYSYDNLKLNVGLADEDFSVSNKSYSF